MVPMEATATPLPTELTTPPVTKIYFGITETKSYITIKKKLLIFLAACLLRLDFDNRWQRLQGDAPVGLYREIALAVKFLMGVSFIIEIRNALCQVSRQLSL
jgi:hypothetical protein